jgi:hypothetical protein
MEEVKKSPEEIFLESAIDVLRKDEIMMIMENLPPVSVVNLCQTNQKFARICNDQGLFKRLIIKHYPTVVVDLIDPRGQFIQLAGDQGTRYVVFYEPFVAHEDNFGNRIYIWNDYKTFAYISDKTYPYPTTFTSFRIKGTVILKKGTKIWLMDPINLSSFPEAEAFISFEDAVDEFLERGFDELAGEWIEEFLDDDLEPEYRESDKYSLLAYMKGEVEWPGSTLYEEFDDFMKDKTPVFPYNVENIREYIMENRFFLNDLQDQNYDTPYVQFTEVEIAGEDYINRNF